MALDEALYELTGAGLIACATGLGLAVPAGAVRAGDAFVGFLSQRGAWGEINRLVEELKREVLHDAQAALVTPATLARQTREAITVLEDVRPEIELLRAALRGPGAESQSSPDPIAPATRIAAQMIARAAAAHPPHRHIATDESPSPSPSHGAQALLHRLLTALLREPALIVGLCPVLQEFIAISFAPPQAAPRQSPPPQTSSPPRPAPPPVRPHVAPVPAPLVREVVPSRLVPTSSAPATSGTAPSEAYLAALAAVGVSPTLELIRAAHDLTPAAFGRFLRTLETQDCPPGAVPLRLEEMAVWLTGLMAALTKPSNEDADTRRLKAEAAKLLAAGDLEAAVQRLKQVRRTVREGRRRIEERLREDIMLLNQQMATEAGIIARQAEMELTRRDYAAAAELFAEARDSLPRSEIQSAWLYGMRQGEALFRLGDEFEDQQALREATRAYRACLDMTDQAEMPRNWVAAQCGLALAYLRLAENAADTAPLETAIAAWRAALGTLESLDEPGQTLVSRRHLARALVLLGEKAQDGAAAATALGEAAAHYRTLAAALPPERHPADWAAARMGLASTLLTLDERIDTADDALLSEAVVALEAAVTVYSRDETPAEWSLARMNMGNALLALGERSGAVAKLEEAAHCFEEALSLQTRAQAPRQWALIKMNLGNALAAVAEHTRDPAKLDAAAAAYREALSELHGNDAGIRRAIAELNLGTVLVRVAEYREPERHRLEAMAVMMSALETFEAQQAAAYVRIAQTNLRSLHRIVGGALAKAG